MIEVTSIRIPLALQSQGAVESCVSCESGHIRRHLMLLHTDRLDLSRVVSGRGVA